MPSIIGGAMLGASVIGAGSQMLGAGAASNAQQDAAAQASATELKMFEETKKILAPFVSLGTGAGNKLAWALGLGGATQPGSSGSMAMTQPLPMASQPQGQMSGPGGLPEGYRYFPPEMTTNESGSGMGPGMLYGPDGSIVTSAPTVEMAMQQAGINPVQTGTQPQAMADGTAGPTYAQNDPGFGYLFNRQNNTYGADQIGKTFDPTIERLEQTPGYKFVFDQGMKGVQNSFASKGLANSGAAIKGAVNFAEGLAGTTFQNQFNNWMQERQFSNNLSQQQFDNFRAQQMQDYNMLMGTTTLGANAAAGQGQAGTQVASDVGRNTIGAGNAAAAGYNSMGNAVANAVGSGVNNYAQYNMMQKYLQPGVVDSGSWSANSGYMAA